MCYSSNPNYGYDHHVDGNFECMDVLAAASCRRRSAKCTKEVPRERTAHIFDKMSASYPAMECECVVCPEHRTRRPSCWGLRLLHESLDVGLDLSYR